jgi:hypothetical protein
MSDSIGYEQDKCLIKLPGCHKNEAGYQRRKQYAQQGPWLDACQNCAEQPYEQPKQFQETTA